MTIGIQPCSSREATASQPDKIVARLELPAPFRRLVPWQPHPDA
jgi:hypothetical protein